jgi:mannosyltransferase
VGRGAPAGLPAASPPAASLPAASLPVAVFLLALIPRLVKLGSRPFWLDEVLTAQRAALPIPALIRTSFEAHHTPVYFLLLAAFAHSADPQFWLRLPSAIFGAADVMLVYLIASRAGGRTAALAAALIAGLSPVQIAFSQDARSYPLMMFFILVALHGLTGLVLNARHAALRWRIGGLAGDWLQFSAGSAAAICVLFDSVPWLLAADLTAAAMIWQARDKPALLRNFSAANAIILACCLPFYLLMLHFETTTPGQGLALVPAPTRRLIDYDLQTIYLMRVSDFMSASFMNVDTPLALTVLLGVGIVGAGLAGIWRLQRHPLLAALLLAAVLATPILFGIVSIWQPLLIPRYLLWSGLPFAIFAGIGFSAVFDSAPAWRQVALAVVLLLFVINLIPFYNAETRPRWDIAARILAAQAGPGDVTYFSQSSANWTLRYYLPERLQPDLFDDGNGGVAYAEQARAQGRRVWAIYGDARFSSDWDTAAAFQKALIPLGRPDAVMRAGSRITIWRYDPLSAPVRNRP